MNKSEAGTRGLRVDTQADYRRCQKGKRFRGRLVQEAATGCFCKLLTCTRAAALFILLSAAGPVGAQVDEVYRLQPGDTVRFSVLGFPDAAAEGRIDLDGHVELGILGRISMSGYTVDEARFEVQNVVGGRAFRRYTDDGSIVVLPIRAQDVRLSIASYRPVNVSGSVANPGRFDFEPGTTIRAVIAQAGGVAAVAGGIDKEMPSDQLIRLRASLQKAAQRRGFASISVWAIEATLKEDVDLELPDLSESTIPKGVLDRHIKEVSERVAESIAATRAERAFLNKAVQQARERLEILRAQRDELAALLAADEEEAKRFDELVQRGLTPASRLVDVRRAVALSSNRLLDVQEALSEARLEVTEFEQKGEEFEQKRRIRLLEELEDARIDIIEALVDINRERELISLTSNLDENANVTTISKPEVFVRAYRTADGVTNSVDLPLDAFVRPGDVVEVRLRWVSAGN